ncbi:MAG: glycosyltransferase [Ruminococcaceae bacterium]|nr:glycosyltransferase [Oscillospiraceae bacterium]
MDTVILIPAYKPDMALIQLVEQLHKKDGLEILVVDDGSGEEFAPVFAKLTGMAAFTGYEINQGKGHALKFGFKAIQEFYPNAKYIITADADGQHKPDDILAIRDHLMQGKRFVIGARRFQGEVPFRSRFGNTITQFVFRFLAQTNVSDTQTGLRGFAVDLIPDLLSIPGARYEYETYMLLHFSEQHVPIDECPIATIYENNNQSSHFHPLRDSFKIYKAIFSFSKPAKFLVSSFLAFLVDTILLMLMLSLDVSKAISIGVAWVVSSLLNFTVNQFLVFRAHNRIIPALGKYYLLAIIILCLKNYGLFMLLTDALCLPALPGKLLAEISFFILNYIAQKKLIFRIKRS